MKKKLLILSAIAGAAITIWIVTPEWLRSGFHWNIK
jgi:hypothetical protein